MSRERAAWVLPVSIVVALLLGLLPLPAPIMAFILQRFRARLRFFPLSQQSLAIGALLVNDRIVTTVLHFALGEPLLPPAAWAAPAIGMLLWPPMFLLFDTLRLKAWRHR